MEHYPNPETEYARLQADQHDADTTPGEMIGTSHATGNPMSVPAILAVEYSHKHLAYSVTLATADDTSTTVWISVDAWLDMCARMLGE